jgi:hypothetical protein
LIREGYETHHVFVSFVVSGTHAEFGFGVLVEETLDNLSLVGVSRSYFDVLLTLFVESKG